MKAQLTKAVRRAAALPVAGRPLAVLAGLYRLPEYRDTLIRSSQHLLETSEHLQRMTTFQQEQLPTLLDTVSTMNHRQVAIDSGLENLVKSIPVTIRNLTRTQLEQKQHLAELAIRLDDIARQVVDGRSENLESLKDEHEGVQQLHQRAEAHADSIQYLFGRVEFVRRELMFELRYGSGGRAHEANGIKAASKIINEEKVLAALKSGLQANLGCGHVPVEGYVNVDRRALPGVDVVAEVDDLPFEAGSVSTIYSAHLLEHFPQEQIRRTLLPYWFSMLKPGGQFAAVVPDGEAMIAGAANGSVSYENFREVWFGGQDYDGDFHYNMFTPTSLAEHLSEAGFVDITVVDSARRNGICFEFEITASRPSAA